MVITTISENSEIVLLRLELRSYERQGIDKIPTVHMGPAVSYLERKGIQTNIGNLNRDIEAANSLMQSIRQMVRSLKGWLSDLKEKKAAPVSYTHLDVYKRQQLKRPDTRTGKIRALQERAALFHFLNATGIKMCLRDSWKA